MAAQDAYDGFSAFHRTILFWHRAGARRAPGLPKGGPYERRANQAGIVLQPKRF